MAKVRARTRIVNDFKDVVPRNDRQAEYLANIENRGLTFGIGPAGTGKTFLAVYQAIRHLEAKKVRRIVITRPVIEAGEKLGYLPGDLNMKMDPFMRPIFDAMIDIMGFDAMKARMDKGVIEIAPIAFMRGRTFNDSFIILDEAQNCTYEQLKMVATRIGQNTKCIINGDPQQSDLQNSGLKAIIDILTWIDDVGIVEFEHKDVERSEIVRKIVKALDEYETETQRRKNLR